MMDSRRQRAESIAKRYIGTDELLKELGSGAEGFVFPTPVATAVKVFTHQERFDQELAAYRRLYSHGVTEIQGFAVPKLVSFNRTDLVIEMTIVQPPFRLDFAQSTLDVPIDFPEGYMEEWWERVEQMFDDRFPVVQSLYYEMESRFGIYYYDLAPRNVNFGENQSRSNDPK